MRDCEECNEHRVNLGNPWARCPACRKDAEIARLHAEAARLRAEVVRLRAEVERLTRERDEGGEMSTASNPIRCGKCGVFAATVYLRGSFMFCAFCAGVPMTTPLAPRPEDAAEIFRLRAEVEKLRDQLTEARDRLKCADSECNGSGIHATEGPCSGGSGAVERDGLDEMCPDCRGEEKK